MGNAVSVPVIEAVISDLIENNNVFSNINIVKTTRILTDYKTPFLVNAL